MTKLRIFRSKFKIQNICKRFRGRVNFSRPEFYWIATGKALAMTMNPLCHSEPSGEESLMNSTKTDTSGQALNITNNYL